MNFYVMRRYHLGERGLVSTSPPSFSFFSTGDCAPKIQRCTYPHFYRFPFFFSLLCRERVTHVCFVDVVNKLPRSWTSFHGRYASCKTLRVLLVRLLVEELSLQTYMGYAWTARKCEGRLVSAFASSLTIKGPPPGRCGLRTDSMRTHVCVLPPTACSLCLEPAPLVSYEGTTHFYPQTSHTRVYTVSPDHPGVII